MYISKNLSRHMQTKTNTELKWETSELSNVNELWKPSVMEKGPTYFILSVEK